jgi:flagellar biosynthesis protein FlhG
MSDQANDLRQRMSDRAAIGEHRLSARPRRIVVAGGKGGVGTTTIATLLASDTTQGKTLLIDADPRGGDLALQYGLDDHPTLADVLTRRRPLRDAIQTASHGQRMVAGAQGWDAIAGGSAAEIERLFEIFDENNLDFDTLVIDLGNSPHRTLARLWQTADTAIMVANHEPSSILGAYQAIKAFCTKTTCPATSLLVNRASASTAANVHRRIARTANRFLGIHIDCVGYVPMNHKRTFNFYAKKTDTMRKLFVADQLLSWIRHKNFIAPKQVNLWLDSTQESSACWHS